MGHGPADAVGLEIKQAGPREWMSLALSHMLPDLSTISQLPESLGSPECQRLVLTQTPLISIITYFVCSLYADVPAAGVIRDNRAWNADTRPLCSISNFASRIPTVFPPYSTLPCPQRATWSWIWNKWIKKGSLSNSGAAGKISECVQDSGGLGYYYFLT